MFLFVNPLSKDCPFQFIPQVVDLIGLILLGDSETVGYVLSSPQGPRQCRRQRQLGWEQTPLSVARLGPGNIRDGSIHHCHLNCS